MDKFIECQQSESGQYKELELLCDPKKKRKENTIYTKKQVSQIKFIDKSYLDSFKEYVKSKIETFNPTIKKDNFDILLISMWHQYIFSSISEDKYYDFVKKLNSEYK